MRRISLIVALAIGVSTSSAGAGPPGQTRLPVLVPPFPFVKLEAAAREMGDPAPSAAVWVESRQRVAVKATIGDTVNGNEPVYVAVITGHFTAYGASRPYATKAPTGTVATIVYDARTGISRDFGLSDRRPRLDTLGAVHDFLPYLRQAAPTTGTAAANKAAAIETQWLERLSAGSRLGCHTHFANEPPAILRSRLAVAAASGHFTVANSEFLHACQLAPMITLRTADRRRLAALLPALEERLDRVSVRGTTRWAYEGFLLEASDLSGKPFVVIWNHVRAENAGGQWASSPDLYPFEHG